MGVQLLGVIVWQAGRSVWPSFGLEGHCVELVRPLAQALAAQVVAQSAQKVLQEQIQAPAGAPPAGERARHFPWGERRSSLYSLGMCERKDQ